MTLLEFVDATAGRTYYPARMAVLIVLFWASLGALAWTHVLYPAFVAVLARIAPRRVRKADIEPSVTVVVAAYNEESVIARRIENLLELDYPADRLQIVVSSDASSDRTEEIALQYPGVLVISNPRGGKVAAQDRAVRQTDGEIVAFSDANCTWSPDALRTLVRAFADPEVAYVCGQLRILDAEGGNKEGVYWSYEMKQRAAESQLGSITGGNGSIYAVRRSDYVEVDPRFGHDLSLPYLLVQHGRRAVYEPEAHAWEKPTPSNETEYRRKVRMFEHCWLIVLRGKMLRRLGPLVPARDRLSPPAALRLGDPARGAARDLARALLARLALRRRAGLPARACSPRPRSVSALPATTCWSPGRRSWRS